MTSSKNSPAPKGSETPKSGSVSLREPSPKRPSNENLLTRSVIASGKRPQGTSASLGRALTQNRQQQQAEPTASTSTPISQQQSKPQGSQAQSQQQQTRSSANTSAPRPPLPTVPEARAGFGQPTGSVPLQTFGGNADDNLDLGSGGGQPTTAPAQQPLPPPPPPPPPPAQEDGDLEEGGGGHLPAHHHPDHHDHSTLKDVLSFFLLCAAVDGNRFRRFLWHGLMWNAETNKYRITFKISCVVSILGIFALMGWWIWVETTKLPRRED